LASRPGEREHNAHHCTYIARRFDHFGNRKSPTSSTIGSMAKTLNNPRAAVQRVAQLRSPAPRSKRSLSEPFVDMRVGEAQPILTTQEPGA
jgi:hypothetical protein